jgi:hypothetical protein
MRSHPQVQDSHGKVRAPASSVVRSGSLLEVLAINLAWPIGLTRFVQGVMGAHSDYALQGLAFFFVVFFYVLVRLYQLRRID